MVKPHQLGKTTRMSFSKIDEVLEIPNLLEVQKKSYRWFLEEGLQEVLRDVSPIIDYSGNKYIEFVDFTIDETPKYPEEECKERDVNYCAPLRVRVRLYNKSTDEVVDKVIFMGDFPLMTDNGTFIINGADCRFADRPFARYVLRNFYRQVGKKSIRGNGDPLPRRMARVRA